MYLPELPYHIVQRGNNREACFIEAENYQFYLELWKEISKRYGVLVHSFLFDDKSYSFPRNANNRYIDIGYPESSG
jgi:hypothetical protein